MDVSVEWPVDFTACRTQCTDSRLGILFIGGHTDTALSLVWAYIGCNVVTANTLIIAFSHNRQHISKRPMSTKESGTGETVPWGTIKE